MARYKNSEGYVDTTAYYAERNAEKQEKKHNRYLKHGKGYPTTGYRIGELYCFKVAKRTMERQR